MTWEIFFLNGLMIIIFLVLFPTINEINYYLNHVFYFDNYDPTFLIRRVTKILATKHDPEDIFKRISSAVHLALGTTFVGFIIRPDGTEDKIITTPKHNISPESAAMLMSLANTLPEQNVNIDIASDYHSVDVALRKHSIAAIVPLKVKDNQQLFGAMLLGPRRHNRPFSQKDMEVINIIADLLIVALANIVYSDKVEKFNVELQEKVAMATTKLRQMNKSLSDLGIAKNKFTSIASNQLKLPINVMRGYLDMFAENDFGKISSAQKEVVKNMLTMSDDIMRVIDKFVGLLSTEEGKIHVNLKEVDFGQIMREEIDKVQITANDVELIAKIPPQISPVVIDEHLIRNVINSIISNAVMYSLGQNKKITINVEKYGTKLMVMVTNRGITATPAEQRQISRRFYRSRAAQKIHLDGTGVELYLAQHIIAAHGGRMLKKFDDKETTFGFILPLGKNAKKSTEK